MFLDRVAVGKDVPNDVNVIIENSMGACPVKYEIDKDSGMLFVDRFIHTPMFYPGNYGFIPHTLSGDGDPVDVLVMSTLPVVAGAVLHARPVGVLEMEDDGGQDEKIIAVPTTKMFPYHENIKTVEDLPSIQREQIEHFFTHYKDLEKGKWVKIIGWAGVERAKELILDGVKRANEEKKVA